MNILLLLKKYYYLIKNKFFTFKNVGTENKIHVEKNTFYEIIFWMSPLIIHELIG